MRSNINLPEALKGVFQDMETNGWIEFGPFDRREMARLALYNSLEQVPPYILNAKNIPVIQVLAQVKSVTFGLREFINYLGNLPIKLIIENISNIDSSHSAHRLITPKILAKMLLDSIPNDGLIEFAKQQIFMLDYSLLDKIDIEVQLRQSSVGDLLDDKKKDDGEWLERRFNRNAERYSRGEISFSDGKSEISAARAKQKIVLSNIEEIKKHAKIHDLDR